MTELATEQIHDAQALVDQLVSVGNLIDVKFKSFEQLI